MIRDSRHPGLGTRTPARTEDFFDEAQLDDLRVYARPRKRVALAARTLALIVDLVLVFALDLGATLADAVDGGWVVRLLVVGGGFALITAVIDAPFDYWATLVHDRRHGMSNHSVGLWLADTVKEFVLSLVLLAALVVPVYAVIRSVDAWWLIGGVVFFVIALVFNFVYPVLIMPRFNKFVPMPEGELRTRIEEVAALADTSIEGVYTMDGSKRSRRTNAFVAGFGPTKRVVVYDTMVESFPLEQIAQVVAHEIGHYRLNHIPKMFPLLALQMPLTLAFVQFVGGNDTVLGWAGVTASVGDGGVDLGNPAALPVFLAAFAVANVPLGILNAWLSRRNEREADLEALELLVDPTTFVALWPSMVTLNKADLEPSAWQRLNASHPEVAERMQFGLDWAEMNNVEATRPALGTVPEPVGASAEQATAGSDSS